MSRAPGRHRVRSRRRPGAAATTQTVPRPAEPRGRLLIICAAMVLTATTAYASAVAPSPVPSRVMPAAASPSGTPAGQATKPVQQATTQVPSPAKATKPKATATKRAAPSPRAAVVRPTPAPAAPEPKAAPGPPPPQPVAPANATLKQQLSAIIAANSRYQMGVALVDMSDGVVRQYGVEEKFVAASTGKILAAAAYYHLAEAGVVSLAAPMGGTTAAFQIRQMIQQSNNTSWALILGAVGYQGIHDYAASLGIPYDRTYNTLSAAETARILVQLYNGRLLNAPHTAELLSYMQNTNFESLIPAAVPPAVTVFHKYGLLNGNLHDASILVQGQRAFAFVVYSRGPSVADIPVQTAIIRQLTQVVVEQLF
ncbi:serine hydrolase [Arthrobacter sp. FW305-BF8]|uniref:serine hydrolase n=1 Tax=Arthrobacter sp. FW305-BF8 TaxID=2879617 RepID=UPI001F2C8419|nr:serine hydrolase [Arthrobacter sp. FW305-BF8]UKA53358.1 serine hydrolase [Arthrobacter sp. FW305-BF8]